MRDYLKNKLSIPENWDKYDYQTQRYSFEDIEEILQTYKNEQLRIGGVSITLPDQKEIISKGMEFAEQGKLLNDKASIKDYLFGFIDGFRYTKQIIETKGN
jgi:hypothetical protein